MLPPVHEPATIEKMNCPPEEKRQLFPLLQQLVTLAEHARRDGILALDEDLPKLTPPFLRLATTLAIDGVEPIQLRRILRHYCLCSGKTGRALLENILIADGIMLLMDGNNPRILVELLSVLFGDLSEEARAFYPEPPRFKPMPIGDSK